MADFFATAFADVAAVVVAAGVLVLDELDELLPQPAAATANTGSIKITHIFFTRFSFRRRHSRARIAATGAALADTRESRTIEAGYD
ncbi:MAG: hypothetical protein WCD11_18605 [Solirubrobacteraceae bacterium]